MKIEWLNDEMTKARLTRGLLWWKQVALVEERKLEGDIPLRYWAFLPSGDECGALLRMDLNNRRAYEEGRRDFDAREQNWRSATAVPVARIRQPP